MPQGAQLIVGLGNPGAEYAQTRHNAGAWFVEKLADEVHALLRPVTQFQGLHCFTQIHNQHCHLLIPTTRMNRSGQAVQLLASYYKIAPEAILVLHDEIDLPVGAARLKWDGGHGGHNGLRDIIQHLRTKQFYRLRIGIGRPRNSSEVADYVLTPPRKGEREQIALALLEVDKVLAFVLAGEYQKAMQQLHTVR